MSGGWKQRERLVATWFSTRRNPLSGSNNFGDDLQKRFGDIIYKLAIVEVKRRKGFGMTDAKKTRDIATRSGLPWLHFEFQTGQAGMVKVTMDHKTAKTVCYWMDLEWKRLQHARDIIGMENPKMRRAKK